MIKMRNGLVNGMAFKNEKLNFCETCVKAKQHRLPFACASSRSEDLLDLVHADLCAPMETTSIVGSRYFLLIIDDYSRKVFVYFLKNKSETLNIFIDFKVWAENQTNRKIKKLRTDNGTEFCSKQFNDFCRINGIEHQLSNMYTPQQNGVVERYNRTVIERAKCLMFDANLEKPYWGEGVNAAVYILNRSPTAAVKNRIPEEMWSGKKVDLGMLKNFGSPAMVHVPKEKRHKWDPKSRKLIFVGYADNKKGYRCIDPTTKEVVVSRDIVFHEDTNIQQQAAQIRIDSGDQPPKEEECPNVISKPNTYDSDSVLVKQDQDVTDDTQDAMDDPDNVPAKDSTITRDTLRKSSRQVRVRQFEDFITYSAVVSPTLEEDPSTVDEAISSQNGEMWKLAILNEMESLDENNTWSLEELPKGRKAIKSK